MITLPITLTIAGAAALVSFWIAGRIGRLRSKHGVMIGDGGNEALTARMRAHANFAEYAPLFLILLALVELATGSQLWLWGVAILFTLGRILHVFGMDRPAPNPFRMLGMAFTLLTLIGLACYAIAIPYLERAGRPGITYAAAQPERSTESPTNGLVRRS